MSQYSTGTASVTNGSATVTGSGTLWSANVSAADSFTVAGDGVMYDVASVDSDTQVTLSVAYAGSTASGVVYTIARDFTSPDGFPELTTGDIETPTIITRALRKIQGKISSILAGGSNANFTAMPQVGGDPIVESGSNADGEWTRFSDGTQICTGTDGAGIGATTFTLTFPNTFINTNYSITGDCGFASDDFGQLVKVSSPTTSEIVVGWAYGRTLFTNANYTRWAINGRWK